MKATLTFLIMLFFTTTAFLQAPQIPIDFEDTTLVYTWNDFSGGEATIIDNPDASGINTSTKVGQMVKNPGDPWGGSALTLAGPVDFGSNNAIKMKVWANRIDAPVLFKLEGGDAYEVEMNTTVANAWEELTFSFEGFTGGTYTVMTIIYDLGTVGDGSADFTLYFDDIEFTTVGMTAGVELPIDFEDTTLTYDWADFSGGVATVIDNPDPSGINTSSRVGQMVKNPGDPWGGSGITLLGPIDWGNSTEVKMKVWANRTGASVLFKLEGTSAPVELFDTTTVANAWEELTFDVAPHTGGVYNKIVLIYELGTVGDGGPDFTFFFDDIVLSGESMGGVEIPVSFEDTTLNYVWSDFSGGAASVIDNPDASGINMSTRVGQMVKNPGDPWGGSTLTLDSPVDFGDDNAIKMKVWANRVDAPVLFKLEGAAPMEVEQRTTVANQWEELTFSFEGFTDVTYTAITIIYDLGTVGDGGPDFTLFFDDIAYTSTMPVGVQLPIDFEDTTLTYAWADFSGGVATVIDNPDPSGINTSARVGQMVKNTGDPWGGSALTLVGPIDFGNSTEVKMKVWANRTGASVLFKLEGTSPPVEIYDTTTVANQWEELTFDVAPHAAGIFNKVVLIYDNGTIGDGGPDFTFFFDDIRLDGASATLELQELSVQAYPNPVIDYINISAEDNVDKVEIYNLLGQRVLQQRPESARFTLDLSHLIPATYILKTTIDKQEGTTTIIKR